MIVAISCDHAGNSLKARVQRAIEADGHHVLDANPGPPAPDDDYPDRAREVALALLGKTAERGILVCGSGVGASVAATKFRHIRAAVCHDTFSARQGVEDDDMNVLCLGSRVIGPELAGEIVAAFLRARFSEAERHRRRLGKVEAIETLREGAP